MQTKLDSFREAVTNTLIGYVVYFIAQLIVFSIVGIHSTWEQNFKVSLFMTAISLVKYYLVRRYFNKKDKT